MATFYANYPVTGSAAGNNSSVGPTGSTAPASATEIGIIDSGGDLQGVSSSNPVPVTGSVASSPNVNGSANSTTVSTVATITKPANAVGFILQNDASSTDYIRWADSNSTASTTVGFVLQPGQDSGFVPMSKNLSICAHSSTQNYNIQWVLSS